MEKKEKRTEGLFDIVIIGGGPGGLTAGLYAARARQKGLLIESLFIMGQAAITEIVENFPGFEQIRGSEFVSALKKQVEGFGLPIRSGTVESFYPGEKDGRPIWIVEDKAHKYETLSLVVATGAVPTKLNVPGEEKFTGKGVSYCATCDAGFFREKDIVVVGGGDTAVEEAVFLTKFGKKVTLIHRRDRLRAAKILQEQAFSNEKMEFVFDSYVEEIVGEEKVKGVKLKNNKTGEASELACDGVFIFAGWRPNTDFVKGQVEVDKKGHIVVDHEMKTSREGVFAAGDCCKKHLNQIITACGDGATAAYSAQLYTEELKGISYK
jgi:thioredoxin reductase (NADPH)